MKKPLFDLLEVGNLIVFKQDYSEHSIISNRWITFKKHVPYKIKFLKYSPSTDGEPLEFGVHFILSTEKHGLVYLPIGAEELFEITSGCYPDTKASRTLYGGNGDNNT